MAHRGRVKQDKKTMNDMTQTPRGSTPVPDPTVLTTQQLTREIAASRELIETRLDAMDKAIALGKANADAQVLKIPCLIRARFDELRRLTDEKFKGVETQFKERDERADKIAELGQKALEAALSAAKEAVGKTEMSFTKQIDATAEQIQAEKRATDGKFEDVKARLGTLEASINTRAVVVGETGTKQAWLIPMVFLGAVNIIGIAVAIVVALTR
jgi:hypothetical protein